MGQTLSEPVVEKVCCSFLAEAAAVLRLRAIARHEDREGEGSKPAPTIIEGIRDPSLLSSFGPASTFAGGFAARAGLAKICPGTIQGAAASIYLAGASGTSFFFVLHFTARGSWPSVCDDALG